MLATKRKNVVAQAAEAEETTVVVEEAEITAAVAVVEEEVNFQLNFDRRIKKFNVLLQPFLKMRRLVLAILRRTTACSSSRAMTAMLQV